MLSTMSHDPVCVGAWEVTFETVKVRWLVVGRRSAARIPCMWTVEVAAVHVTSILLKLFSHQTVQSVMTSWVLTEASFVTEGVAACFPHAVKVSLMFPVTTVRVAAILIKTIPKSWEERKCHEWFETLSIDYFFSIWCVAAINLTVSNHQGWHHLCWMFAECGSAFVSYCCLHLQILLHYWVFRRCLVRFARCMIRDLD